LECSPSIRELRLERLEFSCIHDCHAKDSEDVDGGVEVLR
jgi:hypothetical protein